MGDGDGKACCGLLQEPILPAVALFCNCSCWCGRRGAMRCGAMRCGYVRLALLARCCCACCATRLCGSSACWSVGLFAFNVACRRSVREKRCVG